MRLETSGAQLTYCTNVHRGETWTEVLTNLRTQVAAVKQRFCPDQPFGVGLWLSRAAVEALEDPGQRALLSETLAAHGLYLFTLNGFPYGAFHSTRIKEQVYRPDWLDQERAAYTQRLAEVLADVLPSGAEGTISTVPGGARARIRSDRDRQRIAELLLGQVLMLDRLRDRTGKTLALALEPEPGCLLESSADAVSFFERQLFSGRAFDRFLQSFGGRPDAARETIQRHLGLCYDACHFAVGYEEPADAVAALRAAGIRIAKVQLSSAIRVAEPDRPEVRQAVAAYADEIYLHQVSERRPDGEVVHYGDLPEALESPCRGALEWRIHFHVPIFKKSLARFGSTQSHLLDLLTVLRRGEVPHFEVETYTWDVLPEQDRPGSLTDSIVRELRFAQEALGG